MSSQHQLQIPCLGRPFNLGMLYNRHTDKIVPGMSIWNGAKVKLSDKQLCSRCQVLTEDSIHAKCSCLGIDHSLKLSFLSNLVEVEGAAKFLNDQRSSEKQARVTLHYRFITHLEELNMDQLGEAESLVDEQMATHVVTGIQYGYDAFFVFDRDVKKTESVNFVNTNMVHAVQAIPDHDNTLYKYNEALQRAGTNLFQCKFYGDIHLMPSPTTFDEAVKQFRKLSSLFETQASSVPNQAFLCPLSQVIKRPTLVLNPVSPNFISQIEEIKEHFSSITMRVNNLLMRTTCHKFPDIKSQLTSFKKSFTCFVVNFEEKLSHLVPKIRSGIEDVKQLTELVSRVDQSPFNRGDTKTYLEGKDRELKQLQQLLKNTKMNPAVLCDFPGTAFDLTSLVHDTRYEHVVCFAFNVTTETSPFVRSLELYNQTGEAKPLSDDDKEWFDKPLIVEQLKSEIEKFLAFAESQLSTKNNMTFVVTSSNKTVDEHGPCIMLYSGGIPKPIDVPGTPQATNVTMNSISLQWTAPKHVEVSSYRIFFRSRGESVFKSCDSLGPTTTHRVDNLSQGTEYQFKVQALTTSNFPLESALANFKTTIEYYDIVLIGKTGQGKSTLGNKLLNVDNTDESKLLVFQPTTPSSPLSTSDTTTTSSATATPVPMERDFATTVSTTSTGALPSGQASPPSSQVTSPNAIMKKRFLQADDPEAGQSEVSITDECKLMSNEVTVVRVLDVPGFSDSGTLKRKIGKEVSVFDGNLQIIRWVVREQLRSQLKVRRIAYFLPVRGPLEKADGTMQEELLILYHFFGKEVFNSMLVIATNPPKKQFQELGFDDEDVAATKRVFHFALRNAIDDEDIACPPIVYIGLNDDPEKTLDKIRNVSVLKDDVVFPLTFQADTCALCSVKILHNENNEKVSVIDADGNVIPYAKSKCHPFFISKYTTLAKVIGGVAHIFSMGMFLLLRKFDIDSWPGFTNSDEVCVSCGQSPGAKGCQIAGVETTIFHNKKNVPFTPEHSNEL